MIRILYFASLREAVGQSAEELAVPEGVASVGDLRAHLAARGGGWEALGRVKNLRVAVNQKVADMAATVCDGDEIAFFPPVTGG